MVEGVGDHGCEYMTGGVAAVVLGETGRNFAAGMSGGVAYVYDAQDHFPKMFNASMVDIERLSDASEIDSLRQLVADHLDLTASPKAAALLQQWGQGSVTLLEGGSPSA